MRVAMIGTGYVGLVTGTCLADMGNDVVCVDNVEGKVEALNQDRIPIYEPGIEQLVARNRREGRLRFTTSVAEAVQRAQICFIAVGTPPDDEGGADKTYVMQAARDVAATVSEPCVLAIKSTVPVGTCHQVQELVDETLLERGLSFRVDVVSNPEFLKEGKAIEDFIRPDRIVVGSARPEADEVMRSLYSHFIRNGHPYIGMSVRSSELTKYASNVMLATRISLMNEIAQFCDRLGADIMEVRRGVGTDKRLGMDFLYAGIGYGGSCFPKDVKALCRLAVECDCPADILDAVERVNRHQKLLLANRVVQRYGNDVKGRRFAVWGLSFKPKTDDIREAPSLSVIRRLTDAGASVRAYDPVAVDNTRAAMANNPRIAFATSMYDVLEDADALLLLTEWAQFRKPDFDRMRTLLKEPVIFDGRNQYEPEEMAKMGFEYHCIGRPKA